MTLRWAAIAVLLATLTPALAFDDKQFCVAVRVNRDKLGQRLAAVMERYRHRRRRCV